MGMGVSVVPLSTSAIEVRFEKYPGSGGSALITAASELSWCDRHLRPQSPLNARLAVALQLPFSAVESASVPMSVLVLTMALRLCT